MYLTPDLCRVHVCIPVEVGNLDQLIDDGSKISGLVFSAAVDTSLQFGSQGPQDTHSWVFNMWGNRRHHLKHLPVVDIL